MESSVGTRIMPQHKCEYLPRTGVELEHFGLTEAADNGVVRFVILCRMFFEK